MKIKTITIKNFKGIQQDTIKFANNKIATLIGPNGIGKTSFIEAFRFGLTGIAPKNAIRDGADYMSVEIVMDDETEFSRTVFADDRPSKVVVNGRVTPAKNLNSLIYELFGFDVDVLKVATSASSLTSMKSDELSDFLLQYIPEKLNVTKVLGCVSDVTEEIQEIVISSFPDEEFGLQAITSAYDDFFENRKTAKKELEFLKHKLERFPTSAPKKTTIEIQAELEEIMRKEGAVKTFKEAVKLYEMSKKQHEDALKNIKALQEKFDGYTATRPNPEIRKKIELKIAGLQQQEKEVSRMVDIISDTVKSLTVTIERLSTHHCPLSDRLICTTDKTQVKDELMETLQKNNEGLSIQKTRLAEVLSEKERLLVELKNFDNNALAYKEKILIGTQLENAKKNIPDVLTPPSVIEEKDYEKEKIVLKEQLEYAKQYEEREKLERKIKEEEKNVELYDFLCHEFAPKGEVMTKIVASYLMFFEDEINKRAVALKSGMRIKFVPENGVKYLVRMRGDQEFHAFDDLSAGEKTLAALLLLDLVSSLCGTRIMILDDLNHLDSSGIDSIFGFMSSSEFLSLYDVVIVASVNTEEMYKSISKYSAVVQVL